MKVFSFLKMLCKRCACQNTEMLVADRFGRQVGRGVCMCMTGRRVVNAVGRGANARGGAARGARAAAGVLGSRRRRGASEAAIDEARTRLAHTAARNLHSLLILPALLPLLLNVQPSLWRLLPKLF